MSELPIGWSQAALEQIITFSIGGLWGTAPSNPSADSAVVAVMRGADYRDWASNRAANAAIRSVSTRAAETRLLEQGNLVVEVSGGGPTQPVGRVVLIDDAALQSNNLPLILSNFCRRIVLSHEVIPSYVYYQLLHKYNRGETERFQTATTNIRNLNFGKYTSETVLDLAPRPEQERIVTAIEEELSRLSAGVAAIEHAQHLLLQWLDSATQATFDSLVGSGLRLQRIPLRDLCERITKGTTPTSVGHKFTADGVRFVKVESLFEGSIDHTKCAYISEVAHGDLARSRLRINDVLVSIAGTLGRVGIVSERDVPANTNQALAIVRLKEPELALYVMAWLESPHVRDTLRTAGKGVGMGNLTLEQIRQLPIAVPDNEVRRTILERIDAVKLAARRAATDVAKSRVSAEHLKSSILAAAFSGKLVPQDANDEPASALLERIAVEHPSSNGNKPERTRKTRALRGRITV